MSTRPNQQRLAGMMGLLVGEMLALPYDGTSPEQMPDLAERDPFDLPDWFTPRLWGDIPQGCYGPCGGQALCLLASMRERPSFAPNNFGAHLVRWKSLGHMASSGSHPALCYASDTPIERIRAGWPAQEAGLFAEDEAHFTEPIAVARAVALAVALPSPSPTARDLSLATPEWIRSRRTYSIRAAADQCNVTHLSVMPSIVAAVFCGTAMSLRLGPEHDVCRPYALGAARFIRSIASSMFVRTDVVHVIQALHADCVVSRSTPPALKSFVSAVSCQRASYEDTVRTAIQMATDTPATTAMAGALAGLRFGIDGIPERWRHAVLARLPAEAAPCLDWLAKRDAEEQT